MDATFIANVLDGFLALSRHDPEAADCLIDWMRVFAKREAERATARREKRKPRLQAIELRRPTLQEMGINVAGCSACAHTPEGKRCIGCGNVVKWNKPRKKQPRTKKGK